MSMRAWIAEQLNDPTKTLHGMGVLIIAIETARAWIAKSPVDMAKIEVGFGCIAGGIIQDRVNTPPTKAA